MARCRQAQALAGDVRRESILALMRMWGDAHPFVRWEAGRALADTVALYRDRPRLGVSWAASRSPTMSFDEFSALVREEMHAPEAEVRAATADALGLWQRATSVSLLLEALQDPAPMVRVSAAAALGRIGDQDAIKPLGAALSDPSVWVRRAAAAALGSGGAPHAVTDLRKALAAPQPLLVRSALVAALGRIGSASARNALLQHLRDDCPEIRWQAIRGLEQVGDVSALSRLEALLADETLVFGETIAARARAAIAAIEGREIGLWNALRKLFYLVRHRIAQVIASTAAKRSRIEPTEAQAPEE
jgi:HEAT repeat protein